MKRRYRSKIFYCVLAILFLPSTVVAQHDTIRASVSSSGDQANGMSEGYSSMSSDGQLIAFRSLATNLVTGAVGGIFVHDIITHETTCMSVDPSGDPVSGSHQYPAISADGRYVAFSSGASQLVAGDINSRSDVFVYDRQLEQTALVSIDSAGGQGNGDSYQRVALSAEGRYIAFESSASNLVDGDTNSAQDIFVHDRDADDDGIFDEHVAGAIATIRVSVNSAGVESNNVSMEPAISADGRYVAFSSFGDNLVADDTNGRVDVFVYEMATGTTERMSVSTGGTQGGNHSQDPSISSNGRYVAFTSQAGDLIPPGILAGNPNVFVRDQITGETSLVNLNSDGEASTGGSQRPAISSDGRYVAFQSNASNLGINLYDENIYVRDRQTGRTTQVSVDSFGAPANHTCAFPAISANGHYVAFDSSANNLVVGDTNGVRDMFVHNYFGATIIAPLIFPLLF